jgi:hypothetical protein
MIFMAITFDLVLSGNRHSAACEHRCTEDDRAYRVFIFGNTASLVKYAIRSRSAATFLRVKRVVIKSLPLTHRAGPAVSSKAK